MAMTAYSPIYRGTLSDIDTRWSIISQSVDDRTQEEREGVRYCIIDDNHISLIVFQRVVMIVLIYLLIRILNMLSLMI